MVFHTRVSSDVTASRDGSVPPATVMAASCGNIVRSAVGGLSCLSATKLCLRKTLLHKVSGLGPQQHVMPCRVLHCSRFPSLSSTQTLHQKATETPNATETQNNTNDQKKTEEEEDCGPEYIPKRKAKNPMIIIGYAWIIGLPTGVITFILAKRQVDKNRLKQLKIRQRMKKSNEGEYERERYKPEARME